MKNSSKVFQRKMQIWPRFIRTKEKRDGVPHISHTEACFVYLEMESWPPVFKENCLKTRIIQSGKLWVKLPGNAAKITIELLSSEDWIDGEN